MKRYDWLIRIVNAYRFTKVAEIGCYKGQTTSKVLKNCPSISNYYAIDLWEFREDVMEKREIELRKNENQNKIFDEFKSKVGEDSRITIYRGVSWEMANHVSDESLDIIFIDADHAYLSVKKDLQAWVPKVRKGGIVSGHDINLPGVEKAVVEVLGKYENVGINNVWCTWKK